MAADKPYVNKQGRTVIEGEQDVFEAALSRTRDIYDLFERVVVSFSGGKDSTCVLEVARIVAREKGRLPVHVITFDEEVIDPDTVEYVEATRKDPEIDLMLMAVPLRHTLASQTRTHWYCWDPDERDVWARPLPEGAVTDIPGFIKGTDSYPQGAGLYLRQRWPNDSLCTMTGIRVAESFNRRRALVSGGYLVSMQHGDLRWHNAKPVWDWADQDVWRAMLTKGWPHSRYYDRAWMAGVSLRNQRVAPWGNVASSMTAENLPAFYPDFWQKAIRRLPELRAQQRYGRTALYRAALKKPAGITWREYCFVLIDRIDDEGAREFWMKEVTSTLKRRAKTSTVPMPETGSGVGGGSWQFLCKIIAKNDLINGGNGNLSSRDRM